MFSLAAESENSYSRLCILVRRHPRCLLILILIILLCLLYATEDTAAEPDLPMRQFSYMKMIMAAGW